MPRQQAVRFPLHHVVALADQLPQDRAIQHGDVPATVIYHAQLGGDCLNRHGRVAPRPLACVEPVDPQVVANGEFAASTTDKGPGQVHLVAGRRVETGELVVALRDSVRKALGLEPVPADRPRPDAAPAGAGLVRPLAIRACRLHIGLAARILGIGRKT